MPPELIVLYLLVQTSCDSAEDSFVFWCYTIMCEDYLVTQKLRSKEDHLLYNRFSVTKIMVVHCVIYFL